MIKLDNLRPHPLISLGLNPESQIFGTACKMEQGANYLLVAPSGKGKSTILHILFGLRKDFDGDADLDGDSVKGLSPNDISEIRQKKLSMVFQDLRLFPQLTALENIQLNTVWPDAASLDEIKAMAQKLGIGDLLAQKTETLSYGQRQRVAIIRALAKPFKYLLLDEPFSHLDEANTRLACELITQKAAANKAGIILSSLGEKFSFEYDREMII